MYMSRISTATGVMMNPPSPSVHDLVAIILLMRSYQALWGFAFKFGFTDQHDVCRLLP